MPRLSLRLFGPPRLELDGAPVETDRRKALALLAYLAVTGQSHSRETLAALFWPEYDQSHAFAYLRRTLWEINQMVGEGWVLADREEVSLNPDARQAVWLDVAQFKSLLAECRKASRGNVAPCAACLTPLTEAAALYQDHLLAGFSLKDTPAFDDWLFFEAEGLRRDLASALETLVRCHCEQGDADAAIPFARRWLALDPLNEATHRQLMRVYEQAGQHAAALRQYQECARILQEELGAEPQPETTALFERLRVGEAASPARPTLPPAPSPAPFDNLPPWPTPFIGRADELAEIAALLGNANCRLLTLTGPGGAGKTRLAVKAAEAHLSAFSHGMYFVPLAPLEDPAFIISTIADAIGFSFFSQTAADDQPMQKRQLLNFLSAKQMLLVLDNFEHLTSAASLLTEILQAAPQVKILATSRERFNLQEEWVLAIGGMRTPAPGTAEDVEAYSAVQLFAHNARKAVVGFTLGEAERPFVIRICHLVEGLPLGLELASAWVKTLSCREIAEEIERSLDFLTTPLRDVPERHQSLRAVFEHSWSLLTVQEQNAFRRLSVMSGGFGREAALAIAGATLPMLAALVDKSLLYRNAAGRYEMHQVLRQYAAEKLDATPENKTQTLARHSAFYADFMRARERSLRRHGQKQALEQITAEIENIRAGFRWAVAQGDAAGVDAYLDALFEFYEIHSRFQEAEEVFGQALAALQPKAEVDVEWAVVVSKLLARHGWFCFRLGRVALGSDRVRQSLVSLRRLAAGSHQEVERARRELARVNLIALAWLAFGVVMDAAEAESVAQESLAYCRAQNDTWGIAQLSLYFGWQAQARGDFGEARRLFLESLAMYRAIGDDSGAVFALNTLGELLHHIGEYVEARQCYQDGLALARELGDRWAISLSLDYSGFVARRMGDYAEARRQHEESLAISREIGDQLGVAGSLDNLGIVAYETGNYLEAQRLFGEGLALRHEAGQVWSIAISLQHMGAAALALGDYTQAERALQESLDLHMQLQDSVDAVQARNLLGDVRLAQGNPPEAIAYYRQALRHAVQAHYFSEALRSLTGLATSFAQSGESARAVELLAIILRHPGSDYFTRAAASRLLEETAGSLSAEALAEAEARGQANTLEAMLATVERG